jgi:hypothetical protein
VVSVPLNKGASVVLDASGAGRVQLGPDVGPPRWQVTRAAVRTSRPGQRPVPTFTLYLGTEDANGLIDQTYDGSSDTTDLSVTVFKGAHLIGVWAGGQAGDVATLSVYGEQVSA